MIATDVPRPAGDPAVAHPPAPARRDELAAELDDLMAERDDLMAELDDALAALAESAREQQDGVSTYLYAVRRARVTRCRLALDTGQRGQPRPDPGDAATCDIGTFERQDG